MRERPKGVLFVENCSKDAVFALYGGETGIIVEMLTGSRAAIHAGYATSEGIDAFQYGGSIGYDFSLGGAVAGISFEVGDSTETGRELAAIARVGVPIEANGLIYVHGGYTNLEAPLWFGGSATFEGFRVGPGFEVALNEKLFLTTEYRYANYDAGLDAHSSVLGLGIRF